MSANGGIASAAAISSHGNAEAGRKLMPDLSDTSTRALPDASWRRDVGSHGRTRARRRRRAGQGARPGQRARARGEELCRDVRRRLGGVRGYVAVGVIAPFVARTRVADRVAGV